MHPLLFILFFNAIVTDTPELNLKVIEYVETKIGLQVDRGECWDLAAAALDHAGAYLDRSNKKNIYVFGRALNPSRESVLPGDILQLENVKLEYQEGEYIITENMAHHTAIIYEVIDKGHFRIAHQNTSFSGKKVGISELKTAHVKSGKIYYYRPVRK